MVIDPKGTVLAPTEISGEVTTEFAGPGHDVYVGHTLIGHVVRRHNNRWDWQLATHHVACRAVTKTKAIAALVAAAGVVA